MALEVIQRPEEDLFVEENPTAYDTPYFTSRWNAANLPLVYKISNTKFPVNTEDVIEDILTIETNAGFAQLNLDGGTTYTFLEKGTVKITNTTNYNGTWTIRSVIDFQTIVINAPFVADETGNIQNYYNNYSTLVKVYAGLPEYHPSNLDKPMELITDNPITVVPNASNIATIDVASLVKSKLSLNNDYDVNDLDQFTALFIEYAEQYDESDGTTVSVTTTLFTQDVIAGCDPSAGNFVTNGDFTTDLTGWSQSGSGASWSVVSSKAQVTLNTTTRNSRALLQENLGLTGGTQYALSFVYDFGVELVTVEVRNNNTIYEETLTGTGTVNIDFIADNNIDSIVFFYRLESSLVGDLNATLDTVSILNELSNPCLAYIFSTHSALQPQSKYGGNIGEYVQNFNGGSFANKWLTLMEKPVLFKGNYFDLSTIIPQSVIQSAVQSGGYFLEIVEYDVNGDVIAENQYPITENLGDGIYRFRLDNKTFQDKTKEFTAQILRIPVNLFADGDQGTFDTTSDPTGNPPSDWNLEKDARAIINFEDTIVQAGTGALKFQSRSIFNDDYGFRIQADDTFSQTADANDKRVVSFRNNLIGDLLTAFDFTNDFNISFDFYLTDYYDLGFQNIFVAYKDPDNFIRVVTGATGGFNDDLVVAIRVAGVQQTLTFADALLLNTLYSFELIFNQGVDFTVNLNASTQTNSSGITIVDNYQTQVNFGGNQFSGTFRPLRAVIQNFRLEDTSILRYLFKFNQEQGAEVFENESQSFFNVLQDYENTELAFGGGAWIDTTTL